MNERRIFESSAPKERNDYPHFPDERLRQDVYIFCKGLADYMAEEDLKNVVFIDNGARNAWIGVNEYWNMHYKDIEKPGFYFVNPDGFEKEDEKIKERFSELYFELTKKKDEPLVLFDTCSHSGDTMRSVYNALSKIGFTDIRIITAHKPDNTSRIKTNKDISEGESFISCYPFSEISAVKKGKDIVSVPDHNTDQSEINIIRDEVKRIIQAGENTIEESLTIEESYNKLVDELNVSDKEKKLLKSIVENKRSGLLILRNETRGQTYECQIPSGGFTSRHLASTLIHGLLRIKNGKISVSFLAD